MKTNRLVAIVMAGLLGSTTALAVAQGQNRDQSQLRDLDRTDQVDRQVTRDLDLYVDQDRNRLRNKDWVNNKIMDRTLDRDRTRDRIHVDGTGRAIYGAALMSDTERANYRQQLLDAKTVQAQEQVRAQHKEAMQKRAQTLGVPVPAADLN